MKEINFGCNESPQDARTVQHSTMAGEPLVKGGYTYGLSEIENQHHVGICTAISIVQNREKVDGLKYSPDFQYLLQKKYIDQNWSEGSSIMSALKVAKLYGFLPMEKFSWVTEQDRLLPYDQYIAKLQLIPLADVLDLLKLCVNKIPGYAQIDISDSQLIAKSIIDSEAGILCRYSIGSEWWTQPIDPLRPPKTIISGHAINMSKFDYTLNLNQTLANAWGNQWNLNGTANIIWDKYKPTEAWIILQHNPIPPYIFKKSMQWGERSEDVKQLQKYLREKGFFPTTQECTGYYGSITAKSVLAFQLAYKVASLWELYALRGSYCGKKTIKALNA